jgi:hypothetical protein
MYTREYEKRVIKVIDRACRAVENQYTPVSFQWKTSLIQNKYCGYVEVHVLIGNPVKGMVIGDYCSGVVRSFGENMRALRTYHIKGGD